MDFMSHFKVFNVFLKLNLLHFYFVTKKFNAFKITSNIQVIVNDAIKKSLKKIFNKNKRNKLIQNNYHSCSSLSIKYLLIGLINKN